MLRSAALSSLLAPFLAHFALASWGRAEVNDPQRFAERSRVALESKQVRGLLTEKISKEIWTRTDLRKFLEDALPEGTEPLAVPGDFAARALLSAAIDNLLQEDFVRDIWQESVRVTYSSALLSLQGKESLLLTEKENVVLDLSAVIRAASGRIGLPESISNNIPPGLGQVSLGKVETVSRLQKAYGVIDLAPAPLLLLSIVTLFLLLLVNRHFLWIGFVWGGGASLASGLLVLFSKSATSPFLIQGIGDPLSAAIASALWREWAASINSAAMIVFLLAAGLFLLALWTSPLLAESRRRLWQKLPGKTSLGRIDSEK
jgi:hypothetical protein